MVCLTSDGWTSPSYSASFYKELDYLTDAVLEGPTDQYHAIETYTTVLVNYSYGV